MIVLDHAIPEVFKRSTLRREAAWDALRGETVDVAIIGGGVVGACTYARLRATGYRVLLVDKGDFAGATSQASGMMIWGGLPYLRNGELRTVVKLCAARDTMLRELSPYVRAQSFRYLAPRPGRRLLVHTALYLYWLLGGLRNSRPRSELDFPERSFLHGRHAGSLTFDEGVVGPSDAGWVLDMLFAQQTPGSVALNYCAVRGGAYEPDAQCWRLELCDAIGHTARSIRTRWVVNAAGVWTDALDRRFGIETSYKHVFSKGVFINVRRLPEHRLPLVFETRAPGDYVALIPWGLVSMFGPTEMVVPDPDSSFQADGSDVRQLLDELNHQLARPCGKEDIVSLRCGVRTLAVERSWERTRVSQRLSRRHFLCADRERPWLSVFGGRLTNCGTLAEMILAHVRGALGPRTPTLASATDFARPPEHESFAEMPGPVVSARWAAEHAMCWCLDDYLRRRTNISQWVPRGGFGRHGEHAAELLRVAETLGGAVTAAERVAAYRVQVEREFDRVLAEC